jgi:hypothetical protein
MDEHEQLLLDHSEAQHGIFTLGQIRAIGLSDDWRRNRLADGRIVPVFDLAYRFAGTPLTEEGHLLAAVWAGGPRGRVSHRAAAHRWRLAGGDRRLIEITCVRWRRARCADVIVHESRAFAPIDHTELDGFPITTPARTILDLGAVVRPVVVEMALNDALRTELVTLDQIREILRRLGRKGRNGAGVLRKIVDERSPGRPSESPPEVRMIRMLVRNGLPEPIRQFEVRTSDGALLARPDAAYPQWRIALEYDSNEFHVGTVAKRHDDARRLALRAQGWEIVSVNDDELKAGGAATCAAVRQIMRERSAFGVADA